jgi:hypothetical protein
MAMRISMLKITDGGASGAGTTTQFFLKLSEFSHWFSLYNEDREFQLNKIFSAI